MEPASGVPAVVILNTLEPEAIAPAECKANTALLSGSQTIGYAKEAVTTGETFKYVLQIGTNTGTS